MGRFYGSIEKRSTIHFQDMWNEKVSTIFLLTGLRIYTSEYKAHPCRYASQLVKATFHSTIFDISRCP